MAGMSDPFILHGDSALRALRRGAATMTALLRPTLGPLARTVVIADVANRNSAPEILDRGAIIARRTVQLDDPFADMGGMLIRQLAWDLHETVGDGAVTACLIAEALVEGAAPLVAAGFDPVAIVQSWRRLLGPALAGLSRQAVPIGSMLEIRGVIQGTVRDPSLVEMIAEMMAGVGADGSVTIEESATTESGYHFIEGISWREGWASPSFAPDTGSQVSLESPGVFVSVSPLITSGELLPVLEACLAGGKRALLVIAPQLGDEAIKLLLLNRDRGVLDAVGAVRAPLLGRQQAEALGDIAALTGARVLDRAGWLAGDGIDASYIGSAAHAWITRKEFGLSGGITDRQLVRERLRTARAELRSEHLRDETEIDAIRARIGRLGGVAAIIRIGAQTKLEQAETLTRVEAAVRAARAALSGGVVAGGGRALVHCAEQVERLHDPSVDGPSARVFVDALRRPMRELVASAGLEPSLIVEAARDQPADWTFDVTRKAWANAFDGSILDPVPMLVTALEKSVSIAGMLLTTGALIRHRNPSIAQTP